MDDTDRPRLLPRRVQADRRHVPTSVSVSDTTSEPVYADGREVALDHPAAIEVQEHERRIGERLPDMREFKGAPWSAMSVDPERFVNVPPTPPRQVDNERHVSGDIVVVDWSGQEPWEAVPVKSQRNMDLVRRRQEREARRNEQGFDWGEEPEVDETGKVQRGWSRWQLAVIFLLLVVQPAIYLPMIHHAQHWYSYLFYMSLFLELTAFGIRQWKRWGILRQLEALGVHYGVLEAR